MIRKSCLKILFFALIFISLSIFSFSYVSAACAPGDSCNPGGSTCTATKGCSSRTEYRCVSETDCGTEIQQRSFSRHRHRTCTCGGCDADGNNCTYSCGGWGGCHDSGGPGAPSHYDDCPNDRICQLGGSNWSSSVPNCEYLSTPTNGHPEHGSGDADVNNVYLPVKLNWDDVRGTKSYIYRAWEATTTLIEWETAEATTTGSTTISEAIPIPCALNSSTTFSWKITPCCYADRTVCKNWDDVSLWRFTTNLAPELVSPYDPDWNLTTQMALDVPIPVTLDWCDVDVENIKSYLFRFYLVADDGTETCHPWLIGGGGECNPRKITKTFEGELRSYFEDSVSLPYFTSDNNYRWETATCFRNEELEEICSDYGQKWGFETEDLPLLDFNLLSPPNDPLGNKPVGLPVSLIWEKKPGTNSFLYEVNPGGITGVVLPPSAGVGFDFPQLDLNSLYDWKITPCWDYEGNECDIAMEAGPWTFKTTGAPPILNEPANNAIDVIIPVNFDWDDVSGAGSYRIQIEDIASGVIVKEAVVLSSGISIDYPDLKMKADSPNGYQWKVQTCAHPDGSACGIWSGTRTFETFQLVPPPNRSPGDGTIFDKAIVITLSWDSLDGAKVYQYIVYDPSNDEIFNKIISSNSVSFNPFEFPELGTYNWKVQACLTQDCSTNGGWSNLWSFEVAFEAPPGERGGLVPCGRPYDDPGTPPPMDERESCQIKHLFLLLRNILDFLFFKIATVMLVLLLLAAGAMFYISKGDTSIIFKVKSSLRIVVIGYLIIFFAWFIVNLLLALSGYNFQIFGHWWEIKF